MGQMIRKIALPKKLSVGYGLDIFWQCGEMKKAKRLGCASLFHSWLGSSSESLLFSFLSSLPQLLFFLKNATEPSIKQMPQKTVPDSRLAFQT